MVSSGLSKSDIDIAIRRNFVEFRFTCTEGVLTRVIVIPYRDT